MPHKHEETHCTHPTSNHNTLTKNLLPDAPHPPWEDYTLHNAGDQRSLTTYGNSSSWLPSRRTRGTVHMIQNIHEKCTANAEENLTHLDAQDAHGDLLRQGSTTCQHLSCYLLGPFAGISSWSIRIEVKTSDSLLRKSEHTQPHILQTTL